MEQTIKIYRIDKDNYRFDGASTNAAIIEHIIKKSLQLISDQKSENFHIADVKKIQKDSVSYYLYVHNYEEKDSDWLRFYPESLTSGLRFEIQNLNVLLFADNAIDIFLVIGGHSFRSIVPFIDHTFGLNVISKLIDPDRDLISSIKSRGIAGIRSGISEQFRDDLKVRDYSRFGKVPETVEYKLNPKNSKEFFGFLQKDENEQIKISAGKAFKIKKKITFEELHQVLIELGHIQELANNDYLSPYIQIREKKIIDNELRDLLTRAIYDDRQNVIGPSRIRFDSFKFDFSHPEKLAPFYEADNYVLKEKTETKHEIFAEVDDRENIYETVIRRAISLGKDDTFFNFKVYLQGVRVLAYTESKLSTSASFLFHFTCEFPSTIGAKKNPLFLIDNKWYELKRSFVKDLKSDCTQLLKSKKLPEGILKYSWDKNQFPKESQYNLLYNSLDNYLVFDTITPDGVELCDICAVTESSLYLIHVKYGFNASLRELANQVILSARRVYEDIKSENFRYISKCFSLLENKNDRMSDYSIEEFLSFFSSKKIVFVLAFTSGRATDEIIEDHMDLYQSNIARYSLLQCNFEMQEFTYDINIAQIRKAPALNF